MGWTIFGISLSKRVVPKFFFFSAWGQKSWQKSLSVWLPKLFNYTFSPIFASKTVIFDKNHTIFGAKYLFRFIRLKSHFCQKIISLTHTIGRGYEICRTKFTSTKFLKNSCLSTDCASHHVSHCSMRHFVSCHTSPSNKQVVHFALRN